MLLLVLVAAVPGGRVVAQTAADKDRLDDRISSLQGEVAEASAEEKRLLGLIDASIARKRQIDAKVAGFDRQIAGVQRELDGAGARIAAIEAEQAAAQVRLDEAIEELSSARNELARQAIAAYTGQSEATRLVGMMLRSSSIGEMASMRSYLTAAIGSQVDAIDADEKAKEQVAGLQRELDRSRAEVEAEHDRIASQRVVLQEARRAQEGSRQEAAAELSERNRLRDEVLRRKKEFQAEVRELERESAAIAATLKRQAAAAAAAAAEAGITRPGKLLSPIPGAPITSNFGPRVHPIYGDTRVHTGIDFAASSGTPIRSAAEGIVVSSGDQGGYGIATIINHGGGLATLYAHQSSTAVGAGQRVAAGEVIGRVGSTGASTGPHLHFEVRVNGDPVDPAGYL